MILYGSQRGNAGELANHLMNTSENDHVQVHDLRGFVADNLHGAFAEIEAISKGTKCQQPLFSLSLNPPKDKDVSIANFESAIEQAEQKLGLDDQPRAIVFHEKKGRRHAHVVWSRINAESMKAVNLPHFKLKLAALSKQLYLDHEWELPNGHKHLGGASPDNFTLAQWQQAQRLGLDPREIKAAFRECWETSTDRSSFAKSLERSGYQLARGARRGFVAVDIYGTVYSIPRWLGIKSKEVKLKLGDPVGLQSVDQATEALKSKVHSRLIGILEEVEQRQEAELAPHIANKRSLIAAQRTQRTQLSAEQSLRWRHEARARQERFNNGWRGLIDRITGKARRLRALNEFETAQCKQRDEGEFETLVSKQRNQSQTLQLALQKLRAKQTAERKRLHRMVADYLHAHAQPEQAQSHSRQHTLTP